MKIINFDFKINKIYLFLHTFIQADKLKMSPFKEWVNLQNNLWNFSENIYNFLRSRLPLQKDFNNSKDFKTYLIKNLSKIDQFIDWAIKSLEFKKLFQETEIYLNLVKNEWEKNKKIVSGELVEITGLLFPNKITVLITHPKMKNGRFLGDNTIAWGHKSEWPNYQTVYLSHELMHIMTNDLINLKFTHPVIELATDNELRIRLNNGGKYFKEGKFNVGHKELRNLERKILPSWERYLQERKRGLKKNIKSFIKELEGKLNE